MRAGAAIMIVALWASCAAGQETRGMIFGRVLDPSGAPIAGAAITVINADTNTSLSARTNETGYFEAALLLPGTYTVTAEAAGFKKGVRTGIVLPVGTRQEVILRLEIGPVTESVEVRAEVPLLETNAVSSGRVFDSRSLADLPALSNSPTLLAKFSPGLSFTGTNRYLSFNSQDGVAAFNTAGNVGGNDWNIDGAPNLAHARSINYLPHTDSLLEFKVETSGFDASVGATTGAVVAMMTKAGTNSLHGSITEMHWQQRWAGTPFFQRQLYFSRIAEAEARGDLELARQLRSQPRQPSGHSNNYSATVGGPILLPKLYDGRNKLFFFLSYNGFKDRKPAEGTPQYTVPTPAQRQGDFSELLRIRLNPSRYQLYDPLSIRPDPGRPGHFIRDPIPGNILPQSRIVNPTYQAYLKFIPQPNRPPTDPALEPLNNYLAVAQPYNWDYYSWSNRIDFQPSERHRFFARWSWYDYKEDRNDWTYETARGLHSNGLHRQSPSGTLDWVATPGPNTVLNLSVALTHFYETELNKVAPRYKPSDVGLPAYLDQKAADLHTLPSMSFSGYQGVGRTRPYVEIVQTAAGKAHLTRVSGRHTLQAGFDSRQYYRTGHDRINSSGSFSFTNFFTRRSDDNTLTPAGDLGHSWAAFMMGLPSSIAIDTADSFALHNPYYGWFAQDTWRVTPRLSLVVGLRTEYESGATERYNRAIGFFNPALTLPIAAPAQAAYSKAPLPERSPAEFRVTGGSVYPGVAGADRKLWQAEAMLLPRIAIAWQAAARTVVRAGYGTFYDTYNVLHMRGSNEPEFQRGFFRTTSPTVTTDFGMSWLLGDPPKGISPLRDPFPLRADGTRFDEPPRASLGAMAVAGRSFTYTPWDLKHARQRRWRLAIQHQLDAVTVFEIAYAGSYSDRVYLNKPENPLPEKYWASGLVRNDAVATDLNRNVANPFFIGNMGELRQTHPLVYQELGTNSFFTSSTIRKHQLLRPYPHMSGLTQRNAPVGEVRTDALEIGLQRRFAHGFNLNVFYTRLRDREADVFLNEFDPAPSWRTSNDGRPHRVVGTGIYELPFGKGRKYLTRGLASLLAGGFQLGATYEYQPGPLIDFGNVFYYGNDVSAVASGPRTLAQWFNTDGFERNSAKGPAAYHRRVFPTRIDGLRQASINTWNANLIRKFGIRERLEAVIRLDVINVANRSEWAAPNTNPYSTDFGKITATTSSQKRFFQLQARLNF